MKRGLTGRNRCVEFLAISGGTEGAEIRRVAMFVVSGIVRYIAARTSKVTTGIPESG
jgi:hypothetical protein